LTKSMTYWNESLSTYGGVHGCRHSVVHLAIAR
jgi:hypothetical protein